MGVFTIGTTVTTNLGLIKPDGSESIKESLPLAVGWSAQNETNCGKLDALFRKTTHTYSPSWTSDNTNPTLGASGAVTGKYLRFHPRMVAGYFNIFTGGAGFSAGSGLYRLSIPATVPTEFPTMNNSVPVGQAYLHDADAAATSTVFVVMYDIAANVLVFRRHDGDYWRSTAPITLAQNDRLSGYFIYPTGDA